jgi:hypothetical protein
VALLRSFLPGAWAQHPSALACCALVLLFSGTVAVAQSGRAPRPKGASPPALPPAETIVKPPGAQPQQPVSSLIIVNSVNSSRAVVWTSMALRELIERLKEAPLVDVTREQKEMSRKQAIELAKTKQNDFVVWIQFEIDASMGRIDRDPEAPIVTGVNPGCLFISYVVFEPGTAKVKAQDRVYQEGYQAICTGTISEPPPRPSNPQRHPVSETLTKAAREAADHILKDLDIRSRVAQLRERLKANLSNLCGA